MNNFKHFAFSSFIAIIIILIHFCYVNSFQMNDEDMSVTANIEPEVDMSPGMLSYIIHYNINISNKCQN